MIKIYFSLFLFAVTLEVVSSQSFNGGVSAGFTFCQVDGDNLSGFNKPGITGGFFVNHKIKGGFSYQFEIKYAGKGARSGFNPNDPSVTVNSLKYIEFPLSVRYLYKKKYLLESGLYAAYLIKSQFKDENGVIGQATADPYNKTDTGFLIGINYTINDHFYATIRYLYTLIRIYKIPGGSTLGPWYHRGHYNNVLNFSIFYQL